MGHLRNVRHHDLSRNVLAHTEGQLRLRFLELPGVQHISEINDLSLLIGYLDTYGRLSGNRRLDTDIRRRKTHLDIIGQRHNLRHLDALLRLQLIARHCRSHGNVRHRHPDTEALQRLLQGNGIFLNFLSGVRILGTALLQK